jgi:hypothetical protein
VVFALSDLALLRLKSLISRLVIELLHPTPLAPDDAAHRRARATLPLQGRVIKLCAHLARKFSLAINHRIRLDHIRHHLWTPTPDPSPQGGGEQERRRIGKPSTPSLLSV